MKTLIAALALASLVATPAFAQSYDPSIGTGNIKNPVAKAPQPATSYNAQAQVPGGGNAVHMQLPLSGNGKFGGQYNAQGYFVDQNSPGRW